MPAGNVTLTRADGLHLLCQAPLHRLAQDTALQNFADGLVTQAMLALPADYPNNLTLAAALHHPDPAFNPLLASLLVLDAELTAVVDDETRVLPLPGFLSYRARLPLGRFPLNTLRLPPLNPDGHYHGRTVDALTAALRLDLHPHLKIAGHVRIALGSATRRPIRLLAVEHRLDRQPLTNVHIDNAIATANIDLDTPLTAAEHNLLYTMLYNLLPG